MNQLNKEIMNNVNLTQEEINQLKDVIYNEIDNKGGIENINEDLVSALKKLQMWISLQLWIERSGGIVANAKISHKQTNYFYNVNTNKFG